jgi:glycerate 2-kinase
MSASVFSIQTYTLANHPAGKDIARILAAGLIAVDPYQAITHFLRREKDFLFAGYQTIDLRRIKRIFVIGVGKAAVPMTKAVEDIVGGLLYKGLVITKKGSSLKNFSLSTKTSFIEAGHPVPDQDSVVGAQQLINLLKEAGPEDLILCSISGGGSALVTLPKPGISLDEIQTLTTLLLACGATIDEINTIRKHIDQVKGGGLLAQAGSSKWITLILSDVIGDPIDRIASGPTAPDPSTYEDALEIIERYHLLETTPASIISHLNQGIQKYIPETLKPADLIFNHVSNLIVGNNSLAAEASLSEAEKFGYRTLLLSTSIQGEASQVGQFFGAIAQQIARTGQPVPRPACIIAGGETTVTIKGKGFGGRNQEVALGAVLPLAGLNDMLLLTLATDGGDGPTDAAGAVVSGHTLDRALALGLNPRDFLARNDSYHFFKPLGDLLVADPTLTNVGDLTYLFAL